jgi:hypothetical protein
MSKKVKKAIVIEGTKIVFERKEMPIDKGKRGPKPIVGSAWDSVLDDMKRGYSFLIPHRRSRLAALYLRAKKRRYKLGTRTEVDGGFKRIRVYRIK